MSAACRFCAAPLRLSMLDLGCQPLANSFLPDHPEAVAAERRLPLHAMVCEACWLVQLDHSAAPEAIFDYGYAYLSSCSESWVAHAGAYAGTMRARLGLGRGSLVVEVGSNDGYLLRHFSEAGVPVLGIEPAGHAAHIAAARGVPTRAAFFDERAARGMATEGVAADLIVANNVLAHAPDIRGFAAGFPALLKPQGVASFEFPHLLRLLEGLQFDTIYHEHYAYLSLLAVERVFAAAGLRVFDVETLPTHGGSLRVLACRPEASHMEGPGLVEARAQEAKAGLAGPAPYLAFGDKARNFAARAGAALRARAAAGDRIAAYGAAAKGVVFLNMLGFGRETIIAAADRNPQKQGRLMPGCHVPVVAPEALAALAPDLVLILPWNLRAEIAAMLAPLRARGARLAVTSPLAADGLEPI